MIPLSIRNRKNQFLILVEHLMFHFHNTCIRPALGNPGICNRGFHTDLISGPYRKMPLHIFISQGSDGCDFFFRDFIYSINKAMSSLDPCPINPSALNHLQHLQGPMLPATLESEGRWPHPIS